MQPRGSDADGCSDRIGSKSGLGLIDQKRVAHLLGAMLESDRFPPMLFAGPAGVGKRTAALRLAQAANCEAESSHPCGRCKSCCSIGTLSHPDVKLLMPIKLPPELERAQDDQTKIRIAAETTMDLFPEYTLACPHPMIDPKHHVSIWQARWLRQEMSKPPMLASRRFFIILHAHRMTADAANAFLKTLEEPQSQTAIILTTDRPSLLLDTIRSRCRFVRFSALHSEVVRQWLTENQKAKPEEAELAALVADGSFGKALRFVADPNDFLSEPVIEFFAAGSTDEAAVLSTMSMLGRTPPAVVVYTLLFLYRQALLAKLGMETGYARHNPAVREKAGSSTLDYLSRAVGFLASRLEDCRLSIDRRLFLYTLLSALRRSKG